MISDMMLRNIAAYPSFASIHHSPPVNIVHNQGLSAADVMWTESTRGKDTPTSLQIEGLFINDDVFYEQPLSSTKPCLFLSWIEKAYSQQGGRSWQPFGEGKNYHKKCMKCNIYCILVPSLPKKNCLWPKKALFLQKLFQKVRKLWQMLISRQNGKYSSESKLFGKGPSCLCTTSATLIVNIPHNHGLSAADVIWTESTRGNCPRLTFH